MADCGLPSSAALPRIVHQSWKTRDVPATLAPMVRRWKALGWACSDAPRRGTREASLDERPGVEMRRRVSDRGASTRWLRCVPTFHPPPSAPTR